MIEPGDRICIGVSGGKDSLLLMYGLMLYRLFCKKPYELRAVMLDLGKKEQDTSKVEAYAESLGIPFEVVKTDIGKVVFDIRKEKSPCALCAKLRRGALNNYAVDHSCNKVALGHNREDVLETFFLSMFYERRLNTFGPVTYLGRKDVTLIRPFVFVPEKHILSVAKKLELPILPANCEVAGSTKREEMKNLLKYFCTMWPDAEERIMTAIAETHKYGMWDRLRLPPSLKD
jgi:tRNA(Ile)-lysidine synthase TilS/MesJ